MAKSYLLYKCGEGVRIPLAYFTADNIDEAREAPTWLKRKHPDLPGLVLHASEFFEIIEKGQCPDEEWDAALATIGQDAPLSRRG